MTCPSCKRPGRAKIIDSRARPDGSVRRRHRCLICGCRFTSIEVSFEEFERLQIRAREMSILPSLIKGLRALADKFDPGTAKESIEIDRQDWRLR